MAKNKQFVLSHYPNAGYISRTFFNLKYSPTFSGMNYIWHHESEDVPDDQHIKYFMIFPTASFLSSDAIAASCKSPKLAWKYAAEKIQQDIFDKLSE